MLLYFPLSYPDYDESPIGGDNLSIVPDTLVRLAEQIARFRNARAKLQYSDIRAYWPAAVFARYGAYPTVENSPVPANWVTERDTYGMAEIELAEKIAEQISQDFERQNWTLSDCLPVPPPTLKDTEVELVVLEMGWYFAVSAEYTARELESPLLTWDEWEQLQTQVAIHTRLT